ncbi:hypothetical protein B0H16DRAFT_1325595 [Mycena metata]|uniref:CxC2-like cysteine cluster KDZ transposase-associated domain-containing protein n=1 Tax=Mycena metata TaxID=1033252 RepID=A0AAD7MYU5_9AGAR|nr:hypothetical protein B0H16DRAFT_1325595 [Mycena metata]
MLRRYGLRNATSKVCRGCRERKAALYRCRNCFDDEMLCDICMVGRHIENPLHHVEFWNGMHFKASSLKALGLCVQLGHRPHDRCPQPHQLHEKFVVIHANGIHNVSVDACNCGENRLLAGPPEDQLLRAGWFPATDDRPRTCTTFEVLDVFLDRPERGESLYLYLIW